MHKHGRLRYGAMLCLLCWLTPASANNVDTRVNDIDNNVDKNVANNIETPAPQQGASNPPNINSEKTAQAWVQGMNQAFSALNFKLPLIHLQRNRIQTYSFDHGIVADKQVVLLDYLSGPARQSYRVDDLVTYVDAEFPSYSIQSSKIVAPTPAMFVGDIAKLEKNYRFILSGQGRVAGRMAQLVRLAARDEHRFSYLLWLDLETSLLLRYDLLDLDNSVVEQMQALQLHVFDQPSDALTNLVSLPPIERQVSSVVNTDTRWQLKWTPPGFELKAADSHPLLSTREHVDYLLLTDGLTQISIYVALAKDKPLPEQVVTAGGTAMANHRQGRVDITVVGKIPADTALKLARSLSLNSEASQ